MSFIMTKQTFKKILDTCSSMPKVKKDVLKNHDNNIWWPLDVEDYRKRLLIAGLSTRISYNMIDRYKKIIDELNKYTYEEIKKMPEAKLKGIICGLGLSNSRYKYINSMIKFIEGYNKELNYLDNDSLIGLIAKNVYGASYKVAQCCVLYMRGYYCGIIPVDSGMKDMMLPCLGFKHYNNAIGHDILRRNLQALVKNNCLEDIILKNGYTSLKIPNYTNATWWAHLVLIYYKRHYCNKRKPEECPLGKILSLNKSCKK